MQSLVIGTIAESEREFSMSLTWARVYDENEGILTFHFF